MNDAEMGGCFARDLPAVRAYLLDPLGASGERRYQTATFDLHADRPLHQAPMLASADAIVIVDGTFLQQRELREAWELAVFVRTSKETALRRGIA